MARLAWQSVLFGSLLAVSCATSNSANDPVKPNVSVESAVPAETQATEDGSSDSLSTDGDSKTQDQPSERSLTVPELLGLPYSQARTVAGESAFRLVEVPSSFVPDPIVSWQIPAPGEDLRSGDVVLIGIELPERTLDTAFLNTPTAQKAVTSLSDSLDGREDYVATAKGDGVLIVGIAADAEISFYQDLLDELVVPTRLEVCEHTVVQLKEVLGQVAGVLDTHDGHHSYGYAADPCGVRIGLCVAGISQECTDDRDTTRQILAKLPEGISLAILG